MSTACERPFAFEDLLKRSSATCIARSVKCFLDLRPKHVWQEKSPRAVEREFGLKDKALESLRDRACGFAGMVAAFCQRMKFTQLELLIAKFQVLKVSGYVIVMAKYKSVNGKGGPSFSCPTLIMFQQSPVGLLITTLIFLCTEECLLIMIEHNFVFLSPKTKTEFNLRIQDTFDLQERVQHGVMPELVELARIQGVKGYRARQLFNAGLRTIKDVAESDPATLEAIFNKGDSLSKP